MSPDEPSPPRIPAASDGHVSPAPRRGKGAFLWAVAALLTAAAVFGIFARCVPLNMDEFVSYQTLVALHFPHSVENVFCSTNASFYLRVLNRVTLPLLTYDYIGSLSAFLYSPLFLVWPSPLSARLAGILALFLQALVLGRMFRLRTAAVFCCLLLFVPYSFVHIADTGPVAFQTTSVFLVCFWLQQWVLSRDARRRSALMVAAGLTIAAGCWVKPTYFFVSASLAVTALVAFFVAFRRRPDERLRRTAEYLLLFVCAAVPAALIYEARHLNGDPYLPVITGNFVPAQVRFADWGQRLRDNVLHFLFNPLDPALSCFDTVPALPVWKPLLWLASAVLLLGCVLRRGLGARHRREMLLNYALAGVALALVATNVYAKSMHHAVLAYPFALLAVARGLQLQRQRRFLRIVLVLTVGLYGALFLRFPGMYEQARLASSSKAYAADLHAQLNRTVAADSVIACTDWGIYFIQALYGPRSQVVLFLCSPDDLTQLDRAAAIARRLQRPLVVVGLTGSPRLRAWEHAHPAAVQEQPVTEPNTPWRTWLVPAARLVEWDPSLESRPVSAMP